VPLLHEFLTRHQRRDRRWSASQLLTRAAPRGRDAESGMASPCSCVQLETILRREKDTPNDLPVRLRLGRPSEMGESASRRGGELRHAGSALLRSCKATGMSVRRSRSSR
jgi:hypothetical protein